MRDDVQIDDLANVIFGPLPAHAMTFTSPSSDEQTLINEWSATDLVSLTFIDLPSSDGSTLPLEDRELNELTEHLQSGHATKSNLCRG